jgi:acyl-CoA synthetase (NDP forming)
MEGLKEDRGREFIEVAKKAVEKKPVLVLKTGRSAQGARSASSQIRDWFPT